RLHDAAGTDGDLLLPDRGGKPDHRPDLWRHRSAGEAVSEDAGKYTTSPPLAGGGRGEGAPRRSPLPPAPSFPQGRGSRLLPSLSTALRFVTEHPATSIGSLLCIIVAAGAV